jgi:hypothetical protein
MINKKEDILKNLTISMLGYSHYHMTVESLDVKEPNVEPEPFFGYMGDKLVSHANDDGSVITIKVKNVNITGAVKMKNNLDFDLNFVYYITDSTITSIELEIIDLDIVESDDIKVYIKNFLNNYIQYTFRAIAEAFMEYELISHKDTDDVFVKFEKTLGASFKLTKSANVKIGIKSLFINQLPMSYEIKTSDELIDQVGDYSEEIKVKVENLIANSGSTVEEMANFNNEIFSVDTKVLQDRFANIVGAPVETNDDLVKKLAYQSIKRTGQTSIGNLLTLYDNSNMLSVEKVEYYTIFAD